MLYFELDLSFSFKRCCPLIKAQFWAAQFLSEKSKNYVYSIQEYLNSKVDKKYCHKSELFFFSF